MTRTPRQACWRSTCRYSSRWALHIARRSPAGTLAAIDTEAGR